MSTLVASPAPPTTRPRRRLLPAVLATAGIALVVLGAVTTLRGYAPLMATDAFDAEGPAHTRVDGIGGEDVWVVDYTDAEAVTYAFALRNGGPFTTTVMAIDLPAPGPLRMLQPVEVGLLPEGAEVDAGAPSQAFAPFALGPGEVRVVVVRGYFTNCEEVTERAISILDGHLVHHTTAGIDGATRVDLPVHVVNRSPTRVECRGRPSDRSHRQS